MDGPRRRSSTILEKRHGYSWTKDSFHRDRKSAFDAFAIGEGLHVQDLRGTAVAVLCGVCRTPQEVATITGHTVASVNEILETYLGRTRDLARSTIIKLNAHNGNAG